MIPPPPSTIAPAEKVDYAKLPKPAYKLGDLVATREAWGVALAAVGGVDERIVALDADVKNSTFSDKFEKAHPDRFFEDFIAEQVMVGAAMGFAARGAVPFPSTFACFLTRAADFIRMSGISFVNVKLAGSHAGHLDRRGRAVADGARGSLDDARRCPTARCSIRATRSAPSGSSRRWRSTRASPTCGRRGRRRRSPTVRTRRSRSAGRRSLRQSGDDVATVVGVGVTVFEALKAYDQLFSEGIHIRVIDAYSLQPIDAATLVAAGQATRAAESLPSRITIRRAGLATR